MSATMSTGWVVWSLTTRAETEAFLPLTWTRPVPGSLVHRPSSSSPLIKYGDGLEHALILISPKSIQRS